MKKIILFSLFIALTSLVAIVVPGVKAQAASKVYITGTSGPVAPSSDLNFRILVDATEPINALDLEVAYPADLLKFINADNSGSIVDVWQTQPKILGNGNIGFSGGMLKPFSGSSGLILNLSFKGLKTGTAMISIPKSDLYLADGKGTRAPAPSKNFSFEISENGKVLSATSVPFQNTPSGVVVDDGIKAVASDARMKNIITSLVVIAAIVFILFWVYNKRRKHI